MKMKEVCERTGLTERTVRFYAEAGLVHPEIIRVRGRNYQEYSEENIRELQTAAALRRAGFSLEEIMTMKDEPERIEEIVRKCRERLREETERYQQILQQMETLEIRSVKNTEQLAEKLRPVAKDRPLPAVDFGKSDGESTEEKEQAFQQFLLAQEHRAKVGSWILYGIAGGNVFFSLSTLILSFSGNGLLSLLIQIGFGIALCLGVRWVRWLFIVGCLLGAAGWLMMLGDISQITLIPGWFWWYFVLHLAFCIASAVLLLRSRCVKEYLDKVS